MFDVVVGRFKSKKHRGDEFAPMLQYHGPLTREEAVRVQSQACLLNDTSKAGCELAIARAKTLFVINSPQA